MKIKALAAIAALALFSACGSESTGAETTARPVDAWAPLVQVSPPRDIWEVQTKERETHSLAPAGSVRRTERIVNYNKLSYVFDQIWNARVFPTPFRSTWVNVLDGEMVVTLNNYSDEEKEFFREYISDSPLIVFRCAFETYGEITQTRFWADHPPHINELDCITISAQIIDENNFALTVHNSSEKRYQIVYSYLAAYMNGRWVPILTLTNIIHSDFGPGYNHSEINTEFFTRQIDGPYKIVFILRHLSRRWILHQLTHEF